MSSKEQHIIVWNVLELVYIHGIAFRDVVQRLNINPQLLSLQSLSYQANP